MDFTNEKPIYVQIADNICSRILSGEFKPGSRISSVREWGSNIGVNPNTVARSYDLLNEQGVIYNQRGIGYFVANDALNVIRERERRKFLDEELPSFRSRAALLGIELKNYFD